MSALMAANPVAVKTRDVAGSLPLHCAAAVGRGVRGLGLGLVLGLGEEEEGERGEGGEGGVASVVFRLLLSAYAAGAREVDNANRTPLECAAMHGGSPAVLALFTQLVQQ